MKNNRKGFTLAELLAVVAIIGILVAVSIPIFTKQLNKAREAADIANERAARTAAIADFYSNGYEIKPGSPAAGHYYQYHYDAQNGQVVLQITQNETKIKNIKPYGHKYKLTMKDPLRIFTGWSEFKTKYSNSDYEYYNIGNIKDNTKMIVTVIIYYDDDGTLDAAEWWLDPVNANIDGQSGK